MRSAETNRVWNGEIRLRICWLQIRCPSHCRCFNHAADIARIYIKIIRSPFGTTQLTEPQIVGHNTVSGTRRYKSQPMKTCSKDSVVTVTSEKARPMISRAA